MRRYRIVLFMVVLVVINTLALSFTLVNKGGYKNSLYYRFTRQRFAWITSAPQPKHAIQAGWATVAIKPNGASDSIQARAIVLDNGTTRAAMISVTLRMLPPTVAQALEQRLPKVGFAWKNVYLGATYSPQELSGWAKDYMGERRFGPYDQGRVDQVTEAIVQAVTTAQKNMTTVQLGYTKTDLNGQIPRKTEGDQAKTPTLDWLQLRKPTGETALIYSGTVPAMPTATNASTPAGFFDQLTQQLEKQTHSFTLAMVGAIQDTKSSNQTNQPNPQALAAQMAPLLAHQPLHTDSTLIAQTAPLIQNDPHIRISQNWRLKPWLAKALYGDYPAELKALRIGQTVFVGCPGSVSAEVAKDLLALPVAEQRPLVITSYNGGNLGQIVPDSYYYDPSSPYALGQINRFGPHMAEFVEDMTQSLVTSLK